MNEIFKIILSLSLSGSILILILLLGKPFLRKYFSQRWYYYTWLIVIARLLLPFAPKNNLINACFNLKQPNAIMPYIENIEHYPAPIPALSGKLLTSTTAVPHLTSNLLLPDFLAYLWLIWLGIALLLLIYKITAYQNFVKYVHAGQSQVNDVQILDRLTQIATQNGIKRPVELAINPMLATPLLIGLRKPTIVMPSIKQTVTDFDYTVKHELIHYKRYDIIYKWLLQLTVCLHWFNPLIWLMQKEINRACELSCDEAVIYHLNITERRAYGDALLHAMEYSGNWQNSTAAINFNDNIKLLKERLRAIMRFKKKSPVITVFSLLLTALFVIGATTAGAYTIKDFYNDDYDYDYKITKAYLEQTYTDNNVAQFAANIYDMTAENPLINYFAEKAYNDGKTNFFSIIAHSMNQKQLDSWLERTAKDKTNSFHAILLKLSGQETELNSWLDKMEQQRLSEYAELGITQQDGQFYYQGQLLRILLDIHTNDYSCVTLQTNPNGTLAIKITRDANENILSFGYMTETEINELFGDDFEKVSTEPAAKPLLDVQNLTFDELPDDVLKLMDKCSIREWYLIHANGRQYIRYDGFAWNFAYQPIQTTDGWQINIVKLNKKEYGNLLLSMPDGMPLTVFCDGQKVNLAEIYE